MVNAGDELWKDPQPVIEVYCAQASVECGVHTGRFAVPEPHVEHAQHVLHHTRGKVVGEECNAVRGVVGGRVRVARVV